MNLDEGVAFSNKEELTQQMEVFAQKKEEIKNGIKYFENELNLHTEIIKSINLRDRDRNFKLVATLGVGDSFGELALMEKDGLRAARITIPDNKKKVNLGVLNRASYEKCVYRFDKRKQEFYIDFLLSIPYFSNLTRAVILKIVKSFNSIRFRKGQVVTSESFCTDIIKKVKSPRSS